MPYITPARYRTMGYGVDLTGISDLELATQIAAAARMVNRYCNQPPNYDFRGGSVVDERHVWALGNYMWPGPQKVYLDRLPVKQIINFDLWVTNTQYLNVGTQYLHYDPSRNVLEPVIAASTIGVWSYSAIPVAGYREPEARVSYTYGWTFAVTGEQIWCESGTTYRAANGFWTDTQETVYVDGVAQLPLIDYSVNRDDGTVQFITPIDPASSVFLDYEHKIPADVVQAMGLVTTQLLGNRAIASQGLMGLSSLKIEEIELRQSRDAQAARSEINGLAAELLAPYRRMHWGGQ